MSAWFAVPVCLMIALFALPVRFGLLKSKKKGLTLGLVVGPWRAQRHAYITSSNSELTLCIEAPGNRRLMPLLPALKSDPRKQPVLGPALQSGKYLLGHIHSDQIDLALKISTSDACHTVLLTAAVSTLLNTIVAVCPQLNLKGQLRCAFGEKSELHLLGIFSCRVGHIMLAALIFGREYLVRRKTTWTSTPSKTS